MIHIKAGENLPFTDTSMTIHCILEQGETSVELHVQLELEKPEFDILGICYFPG